MGTVASFVPALVDRAWRSSARMVLAEMSKLEEQVLDPARRWEILRGALRTMARWERR